MTKQQFVFYDLETTGFSPSDDRIMQFAAIKTDADFQPLQEWNFLIKLNDDILPSPSAIKVTGITPQKTLEEGYSEAEAAKIIHDQVFTPNTVIVGFNNIRFDDNFIRFLFWRNYYDPYAWSWKDGRSRWDLLDVTRLVRAVSPEGIEWPVDENGKPSNRLEMLSKANNLAHTHAHDALSDVEALIGLTKLIKDKKGELWQWLFKMRDKNQIHYLVNLDSPEPFVYSSGRLAWEFNRTTLAYPLAAGKNNNIIVWNLRYNPTDFLGKSPAELVKIIAKKRTEPIVKPKLEQVESSRPVYFKEFKYNQCPAISPLDKLDSSAWKRLGLTPEQITKNAKILADNPDLATNLQKLYQLKAKQTEQKYSSEDQPAEASLYDDFVSNADRQKADQLVGLTKRDLANYQPEFADERLNQLFLGYKARSFAKLLTPDERSQWEAIRQQKLQAQIEPYLAALSELAESTDDQDQYLATELQLWLESIMPEIE